MTLRNNGAFLKAVSRSSQDPKPMLSIVVLTFNERDNVARVVERIGAALSEAAVEVIFVDDSDDDTPAIIDGLAARFPISLLHREPDQRSGGLGTALAMGLEHAAGRYICVLDGDLQHPPEKLPELLAAAQGSDADVVVGSRYRPGGSARTLPWSRKVISVASKWISKILFHEKLWQTSDPGSGFFLISRRVLRGVHLRPIGYKMLTEVLMRGRWSRLVEVPYEFQNREAGTSKATLRQGSPVRAAHRAALPGGGGRRSLLEVPHGRRLRRRREPRRALARGRRGRRACLARLGRGRRGLDRDEFPSKPQHHLA